MNFLNVGPSELIVILLIAILVVGPERMVKIARKIGQVTRQLRNLSSEFTSALQAEVMLEEEGEKGVDLGAVRQDLEQVLEGGPPPGQPPESVPPVPPDRPEPAPPETEDA